MGSSGSWCSTSFRIVRGRPPTKFRSSPVSCLSLGARATDRIRGPAAVRCGSVSVGEAPVQRLMRTAARWTLGVRWGIPIADLTSLVGLEATRPKNFSTPILCRSVSSRTVECHPVSSSPHFTPWPPKNPVVFRPHVWHTPVLHGEPLGTTQSNGLGPDSALVTGGRGRCPRRWGGRTQCRGCRRPSSRRRQRAEAAGTGRAKRKGGSWPHRDGR
jgi:hypothetical protein